MFQLTFSILAQLKGKLLIKCELPDDLKTETNEILGWVLPAPAAASATQDKVSFNTYSFFVSCVFYLYFCSLLFCIDTFIALLRLAPLMLLQNCPVLGCEGTVLTREKLLDTFLQSNSCIAAAFLTFLQFNQIYFGFLVKINGFNI